MIKKIFEKVRGLGLKNIFCLGSTESGISVELSEKQIETSKWIDQRRGFSNFTQEERIAKLNSNDEILFLVGSQDQEYFYECANCHNPSHFRSPLYETVPADVYTEGVCCICKKKTKVFHTRLYRFVVQKYGYVIDDWLKSKIPTTLRRY